MREDNVGIDVRVDVRADMTWLPRASVTRRDDLLGLASDRVPPVWRIRVQSWR